MGNNAINRLKKDRWLHILFGTWGVYLTVFWITVFFWKDGTLYVNSISMWLDSTTFLNLITSFKERSFLEWINSSPIHAYQKVRYFFLFPLIPSLLAKIFSLDSILALQLFAITVNFFMLWALYYFFYFFFNSGKKAFTAITIFFMAGGFNWISWVSKIATSPELLFSNHLYQYHPAVALTLIYTILPSRSLCGGIAIAALLIIFLNKSFNDDIAWSKLTALVLASSMLTFIYPQSLLLVFLCSLYLLFDAIRSNKPIKYWMIYGSATSVISAMCLWLYYKDESVTFGMIFRPFWPIHNIGLAPGALFLIKEYGIFFLLAFYSIIKRRSNSSLVFAGITLTAIYFLGIFQPNEYDNSRILLHAKLALCVPVTSFLFEMWRGQRIKKSLTVLLVFLLCFEPVINMIEVLIPGKLSYPYLTKSDFEIAHRFKHISAPSDIVLTPERRNNWVSLLAGRKVFLGARQHVSSLGLPWEKMSQDAAKIYSGDKEALSLLENYKIKFIVLEKHPFYNKQLEEKFKYHLSFNTPHKKNHLFFKNNFTMILENNDYEVFSTKLRK